MQPDKIRCSWAGADPLYVSYHDHEWGVPLHDDQRLFEMLILEGAQAGLSWITVLRKRDAYRKAFDRFDAGRVARYGIDRSHRVLHGALLDSEILADVYLELIGGRQVALALVAETHVESGITVTIAPARQRPVPLPSRLSDAEFAAHLKLVGTLGADALWSNYPTEMAAAE